jgi:soluble lytic murein transglycosylase-like protein
MAIRYTREQIIQRIRAAARRFGIDEAIAVEQLRRESVNFAEKYVYNGGRSPAGAQGVAQFMPGTAARFGLRNPYDVDQSLEAWGKYMTYLLKRFGGRYDLALAGYNAGEGNVEKYGRKVPPFRETREYVKVILQRAGRAVTARAQLAELDTDKAPGANVANVADGGGAPGGDTTAMILIAGMIALAAYAAFS